MQATQQKLEVQLEELDRRFWSHAVADAVTGAFGSGVYRFTAHVPSEDGYDVLGRPFAMARQDAEADDRPNAASSRALARLCELDEQLQESGWEKLAEIGQHWWSLRYTRD
jgi:hypothetical protein